jgi:hypothetical protein
LERSIRNKKEEIVDYSRQLARNLLSDDFFEGPVREANAELKDIEEKFCELQLALKNP